MAGWAVLAVIFNIYLRMKMGQLIKTCIKHHLNMWKDRVPFCSTMMVIPLIVALLALCIGAKAASHTTTTPFPHVDLQGRINGFETRMDEIIRQILLQQLYMEEKIRSDGQSGLKQLRQYHDGTRPYYSESHTYRGVAACHNHANYDRTVGMGELNMVMNGVDFRTRHNDYKLRMPSRNTSNYNAMDDIPFPDVPPAVTSKATLAEQVAELREWFRAWKDQDFSVRDYRKYFKPVLCYMEGAWTTDTKTLSEPFSSDRHAIDASSWHDLQEKIRFTSYSGSKSVLENFAYLPTTILKVVNGTPEYAQWNYRILCHPLKNDIPTRFLHMIDDLATRVAHGRSFEASFTDRSTRFALYKDAGEKIYNLLDEVMREIPGKDNYPASHHEDVFGEQLHDVHTDGTSLLNTGYYHRWYKVGKTGSSQKVIHRGFSDNNLWVAQTNQPRIAPMSVEHCTKEPATHKQTCKSWTRRYTYAVPLEIIYMTPLNTWNPFDLELKPRSDAQFVENLQRKGGKDAASAFNGTYYRAYYLTPPEFFSGNEVSTDKADTTKNSAGVLDRHGHVKVVSASGTRIVLPNIPGVGILRTRYPIVPVHGEGSGVWKELNALKDMLMNMQHYKALFENPPTLTMSSNNDTFHDGNIQFLLGHSTVTPPEEHVHFVHLSADMQYNIKHGRHDSIFTSEAAGHTHQIKVAFRDNGYRIILCDGLQRCWDGHPLLLQQVN